MNKLREPDAEQYAQDLHETDIWRCDLYSIAISLKRIADKMCEKPVVVMTKEQYEEMYVPPILRQDASPHWEKK